jgi:hypothetical protein
MSVVDAGAARHRFYRACAIGSVLAAIVFTWMLAIGRLDLMQSHVLDDFFDAQAHSLLGGRWDVPVETLGFEAFLVDGKAYMYFGPWPALLRLPVAAVTDRFDGELTQLSMLAAFAVLMVATSRLLWRVRELARPRRAVSWSEAWAAGVFVAVVGAGSVVLFLASRPVVYHESELWGAALAIAAFEATLGFIVRPSGRSVAWAGVLAACALLSRGSVAIGPVVALGLVFAARLLLIAPARFGALPSRVVAWFGLRNEPAERSYLAPLAIAIAVPVGIYMYVNYTKFGHPWSVPITRHATTFTDELRRRVHAANEGSLLGPKFIPTNFIAMFRPDAIAVDGLFPWVTYPALATAVGGVTFAAIDPSTSIPSSMPFLFALSIVGAIVVFRPRRNADGGLASLRVLALGGLAGGVGALALPYINQRYLSDFLPALVVLGAAGLYGALHGLERLGAGRQGARRAVMAIFAVLGAFSLWANFGLALLYQRAYSPFPDNSERAAFVRFQHDLDERLPGRSRFAFATGPTLPEEPLPVGSVFVVGDCEGVYWSDGNAWLPIEQTHTSGRFPIRITLRDRPPGTRETLLVAGPDDAQDRLEIVHLRGRRVRLLFASSRLDEAVRGRAHGFVPGRPTAVELTYDATLGSVGATFDGEPSLGLIWGPLPSPAVAGDPAAGDVPGLARRAQLLPTPPRFCSELTRGTS